MKKLVYKKKVKGILLLISALSSAVLIYCLLNIGFWMEDSYSLAEMSRNYEETDLFLRQVEEIISNKIRGQQNQELFEEQGEFDGEKEIDIQSYGVDNSSMQDMNTTYLLSDLLEFAENGGRQKLHTAIVESLKQQSESGREAGECLDEQSEILETIMPVTGISLAECSRWYSNPANFVLEMYQCLDRVSEDIYSRYREYSSAQEESWSSGAPSNLRYCIENTSTGKLYTNSGESSYSAAVKAISGDPEFVSLYEGERSFNIMVANPDNVLNTAAAEWFMDTRFVNTNEKVYVAVDMSYPVSDELRTYADSFAKRESIVWASAAGMAVSLLLLLASFLFLLQGTGRTEKGGQTVLFPYDRIPTELAAGLYMIFGVLSLVIRRWIPDPVNMTGGQRMITSAVSAAIYMIFLSACLSLARRIRTKTLWSNSIGRMLLVTWKKVTAARAASGQLLFFYIIFFVLNFLFLLFDTVGIFLIFVLDMAVLLYLLRDMAGKQSVWEGIHQISRGDFKYKIDTSTLQGETYEMARAVNEMGDGLQKAVDSIVKNERLKAELITNVSHDLKTPLTSIVNYVDLLKRENLQGERVQHYIEVLDQKSQRLKQLTEDLVEASKISSGNVELQMVRMQLQSMIRQACGEFQERLEEKKLVTVWNMEKEPVCIMADGRQLWRILENLLGNIYKYALEGTRIYIDLYRDGDTVYLSLKNTSARKLTVDAEELTGRFVRGDRSRSTEGSGLGLSIAQNLVQLQGGTFELKVDGDLFKVTLGFPVSEEEKTEQEISK
ncbi:MAG: HAMP domain-containing sensor histidine kinase [Candidatus Choladocola sp.]|nr:HAMP domain-containing sensor histidine kinase [Candidatus Choladocola sp.]